MKTRFIPLVIVLGAACGGGGGDVTPPNANPSDLSTMNVGEVRVLNPSDIPNGINLPAGGSGDYVIIVANTSSAHDVPANFVVKADRSSGAAFGIEAPAALGAQFSLQAGQLPGTWSRQQTIDNKVRAFERSGLTLRSASGPLDFSRFSARRSTQVATMVVPQVGDLINLNVPDGSQNNLWPRALDTYLELFS